MDRDLYIVIKPPDHQSRLWWWGVGDHVPSEIDKQHPIAFGKKWGMGITRKHAEARAKRVMRRMRRRMKKNIPQESYVIDENEMLQREEWEKVRLHLIDEASRKGGYDGGK